MVTSSGSPYRVADTPLLTRERQLEQELASARQMLDALANEEARIERGVRLREIDVRALDEVRATIRMMLATETQVARELEATRAELVARGHRKAISPNPVNDPSFVPLWIGTVLFAVVIVSMLLVPYLRRLAAG